MPLKLTCKPFPFGIRQRLCRTNQSGPARPGPPSLGRCPQVPREHPRSVPLPHRDR